MWPRMKIIKNLYFITDGIKMTLVVCLIVLKIIPEVSTHGKLYNFANFQGYRRCYRPLCSTLWSGGGGGAVRGEGGGGGGGR